MAGRGGPLLFLSGSLIAALGTLLLALTLLPMFLPAGGANAGAVPPTFPGDGSLVATPAPPSPGPTAAPSAPAAQPGPVASTAGPVDGVSFVLEVPAIGYSALVYDGVSYQQLGTGPRHYPTTPWPGQAGNIGIAGHNTFWLGFARLRPGDLVRLRTEHAVYVYSIKSSAVVAPDDRAVLAATPDNRLTLTTCYPLWAGALATRRLVFLAVQVAAVQGG